ncbi:MAG TPA: hypothetical protein VJM11_08360 [Nevskiaceae bacterium]|nr:hypothetical protein [Nevskiaceae bacterium]
MKNLSPRAIREWLRAHRAYSWLVLLPSALAALYYGLVASDRYVSMSRLLVERDASSSLGGVDVGLLSLGNSQNELDAWLVKRFIESPAMLDYLDSAMGLRAHYENPRADPLSRLWSWRSREAFLAYYLEHIDVYIDPDSLTIDLTVQGFDREYARKLAGAIAARAEQFVNDVGQSLGREQVKFVQNEVDQANARLQAASKALIGFQNEKGLFSPEAENAAVSQVISGLQIELAQRKTELKALLSYLAPTAPDVITVQNRIAALDRQIEQERAKQIRGTNATALNDLLVTYGERQLNVDIARDIYQGGLKSLEAAKVDASRKVKHLVMVSAPTLPDTAQEPRRLFMFVTVFVLLNLAYLIGSLVFAIVQDHRE